MTKKIVIFISILSIIAFGALVYYGLGRARGIPVAVEEPKKVVLKAPFIDKAIDFTKGIPEDLWDSIEPQEIKLMHQVMILPWGKSLVSPIALKAFHNDEDIYFYITWKDETEDSVVEANKFQDACAILFPFKGETQPSTIMMGFVGKANIWHWKGSRDREFWGKETPESKAYADFYYPFEEKELFPVSKEIPPSAVSDLMAIGVGTVTPKETQNIQGRGFWDKGSWQVVFRRSIKALDPELDAIFELGEKRLCAFAVWNGSQGDRGGRKSISDWVELLIE